MMLSWWGHGASMVARCCHGDVMYRFIDDGLCILKGNFEDCLTTLERLFSFYPVEIPISCLYSKMNVDFLDINLNFGSSTIARGSLAYRIFQKQILLSSF